MRNSLFGLFLFSSLPALAMQCHIHPPRVEGEPVPALIGPFDGPKACEQERKQRFGHAGRCHCAADFSPAWSRSLPRRGEVIRPAEEKFLP